ncbi:MAG: type IV pili twitching motility protein PilT, partial [Pseudomonadota bacterium]
LKALIDQKGSDLHISPEAPPRLRIDGVLLPIDVPALTPQDCMQLCYSVLTDEQRKEFEEMHELDLAFSVKNLSRFRANIYLQKGHVTGVFRVIPFKVHSLRELDLPPISSHRQCQTSQTLSRQLIPSPQNPTSLPCSKSSRVNILC